MLSAIQSVWSTLVTFLTGLFSSIESLFWVEATGSETTGHLTFIGTMGVIMCGVALILLVFNIVRSFLVARG